MFNRIIITATNSLYFDALLTLISSVHKYSFDLIDQIFVYNLGLSQEEINKLENIRNVTVLNFSNDTKSSHPKFMEPKSYVYKTYCLHDAKRFGSSILWMDSGAMLLQSAESIFNNIQQDDIFLVGDFHKNKDYTHNNCRAIMSATEQELEDNQLWAGLIGYKYKGKYQEMINEAFRYSMIPGCLDGNQENHRHDQSILSILASRYDAPRQDIDIYGYWTDSNRNLQKAIEIGSIVFVHRRGHRDISSIKYHAI